MAVKLVFRPRQVVAWEEFCEYLPGSIAVDGFCLGSPRFDEGRRILNINHHEGCDRIATRSSCYQALCAIKMSLYHAFCDADDKPQATIYVNDCDQDVALATYILMNPECVNRPKLRALVRLEDLLDMSAGLYPLTKGERTHLARQLAWINRPYTDAVISERLFTMDADDMARVMRLMHQRLRRALYGRVREVDLDTRYEIISRDDAWVFVRELGPEARLAMARDGIKAFISLRRQDNGLYDYSMGRLSEFVRFPLPLIYFALNEADGVTDDNFDRWGGSSICGGSPRHQHSRLPPHAVREIVNQVLVKTAACLNA